MELPIQFKQKIKALLKEEYEDYIASYEMPRYQGLRLNSLKVEAATFPLEKVFKQIEPVPWCEEGYYYENEKPTKHPYYHAGLYYIQEPSAMAPGAYLPIERGDKVLDLCAAPGGKSTQIGARLQGEGLLVSNDISVSRAKALVKNIENFGIKNVIIVSEAPSKLADKWEGYFDKVLIDAPCSGEGMFRKDQGLIKSWEKEGPEHYIPLQEEILEQGAKMLKPGGKLLYSTCTFDEGENEKVIEAFLRKNPFFKISPLKPTAGIQKGFATDEEMSLEGALRLWPHHIKGEGHFVCLLENTQQAEPITDQKDKKNSFKKIKDYEEVKRFMETYTYLDLNTEVMEIENRMYQLPKEMPPIQGIRVMRSGLLLGEIKKNRFEPSHALVFAYKKELFKKVLNFEANDSMVYKYLKGETLTITADKGYHVILVDGYPLGWVKAQNDLLKNEYPPNWRMMG
jgi:NOL1/NOP2/sun family putative RNA methylase